jgi:hypothetical protein
MARSIVDEVLEQQDRLYREIPKGRFGVVVVDTFEAPPGDPYVLATFATREEAERVAAEKQAADGEDGFERYHVYEGEGPADAAE